MGIGTPCIKSQYRLNIGNCLFDICPIPGHVIGVVHNLGHDKRRNTVKEAHDLNIHFLIQIVVRVFQDITRHFRHESIGFNELFVAGSIFFDGKNARILFFPASLIEHLSESCRIVTVQHQISHHHAVFVVAVENQSVPFGAEVIRLFRRSDNSESLDRFAVEFSHAVTHEFIEGQIQNAVDNGVFALRIVAQAVDQNVLLSCRGGNVSDCCGLCCFIKGILHAGKRRKRRRRTENVPAVPDKFVAGRVLAVLHPHI